MKFTVFRGVFGGLAGVFAALSASLTYASTLNHDLQIVPSRPQAVVWAGRPDSPSGARLDVVQVAQIKKPAAGLGAVEPATPAELAARSLNPGASDPDVPLPHPGLSEEFSDRTDVARPLTGPTPFGRGESGGGVLGLRLPLPAQRGSSGQTTTSGIR
ncbi:hypothetical protein [Reyranella sp.]|jgi:hypothetical protein|uniref:hypothetical protein n=1 Tax=Reyranella sp. TaxID=1929291 RepID=UPI000BD6C2FF|nr:hypothetical protein [Reyranella sp.]OYY40856.1 MAG: hypothetical protein B7Y57_14895 [Rhodospirillales bacterium 35-66-84]OYZ95824.1 MAG: hypothetical protein B7Y08_05150 [Rhodospirillales bacterium 24-66-33]OZB25705.1 MAG: hypothetical protein B7X63_10055 [Rhodospirillales bacterium 39-66-50]HQS14623.1 hypothetical protein [Reyranella sp.]HQT12463.1 hypothetical protein [Reyranella sp.]